MALILPKSAFFHIPKTGGAWVRKALDRCGYSHHSEYGKQHSFPHEVKDEVEGRFCFAFVRNPADWYRSFWAYSEEKRGWPGDEPIDSCQDRDFPTFVRNVLRDRPGFLSHFYDLYMGHPFRMNFVGRTERLADDLVLALRLAGESFDEERLRSTPRENESHLRAKWAKGLQADLEKAESAAIQRFGYDITRRS